MTSFDLRRGLRALVTRPNRRLDLTGRHVLISGGSRGLGLELARAYGGRQGRITLIARDADELARAEHDLRAHDIPVSTIVADIRARDQVDHAVAAARERFGPIDVLVNDAGIIQVAPLDALTLDDYRDAMETHFWGPLALTTAVLPEMRARRLGRIVNVGSIGGRVSVPHLLPYCASKFALLGLSEGLRAELVRDRVYVTTVVPGLMRTGSTEQALFKGRRRAEYAWFSIAGSLPFLSVDVSEAAQQIVAASERGDAELTISVPAKLASLAHGVAPSAVAELLGVLARALPPFGGSGTKARPGAQSHSVISPSPLTASTQHRAQTHNEVPS